MQQRIWVIIDFYEGWRKAYNYKSVALGSKSQIYKLKLRHLGHISMHSPQNDIKHFNFQINQVKRVNYAWSDDGDYAIIQLKIMQCMCKRAMTGALLCAE